MTIRLQQAAPIQAVLQTAPQQRSFNALIMLVVTTRKTIDSPDKIRAMG